MNSKLSSLLITSAASNDLSTLNQLLKFENLEINKLDQSKTNALTYAACGGNLDIVLALLENGARLAKKEAKLVSLMAISNGHKEIGNLIQKYHDFEYKTNDASFMEENLKVDSAGTDCLDNEHVPCKSDSTDPVQKGIRKADSENLCRNTDSNFNTTNIVDRSLRVLSTIEEEEYSDRASLASIETCVDRENIIETDSNQDCNPEVDLKQPQNAAEELNASDSCTFNPDMIIFDYPSKTNQFLELAIQRLVPSKKQFYPLGASILYLAACYCKTISSSAVDVFLSRGLETIKDWVSVLNDLSTTCYWLSNCLQLVIFLKRGLMEDTVRIQCLLSEYIEECLERIVKMVDMELEIFLGPCLVDHLFKPSLLHWIGMDTPSPQKIIDILERYQTILTVSLPKPIINQVFEKVTFNISTILLKHLKSIPQFCSPFHSQILHEYISPLTSYVRSRGGTLKLYTDYLLYVQFVKSFEDLEGYTYLMTYLQVSDDMVGFVYDNYQGGQFIMTREEMCRGNVIDQQGFRVEFGMGSELWDVEAKVPKRAREMVEVFM